MSEKLYEDFTDEDVKALADDRKKAFGGAKVDVPDGWHHGEVKIVRPLADVAQGGMYVGLVQCLIGFQVLDANDDAVPGAMLWRRQPLPLKAEGKLCGSQGRGIAFGDVSKLAQLSLPEDTSEEDYVKAIEAEAKKLHAGDSSTVAGKRVYVNRVKHNYKNAAGEDKYDFNWRIKTKFPEGAELAKLA